MKTPERDLEFIPSLRYQLHVCFVHSTASSLCWLYPDTSLGDTKAERILDFVLSSTPFRKKGIVPSGTPTEDGGSPSKYFSNLTGLNGAVCPPLS